MNTKKNNKTKPSLSRRLSWLLLAAMTLTVGACVQDEDVPSAPQDEAFQVRLLVDPQAAQTRAAGDEDDVSAIKELRVYVFNAQNERVGHYYNSNLGATGEAYYVPLKLSEGGDLSFYVIANEQGAGLTLSEETPKATLDAQAFETAAIVNNRAGKGDLLTGRASNVSVTAANAQGDQVLVVECPLSRPFSLLEVYFAKANATMNAQVTDITFTDYTTGGYIYEVQNIPRTYANDPLNLIPSDDASINVTAVVSEEDHGKATANYGTAAASRAVSLSGYGTTTDWGNGWMNEENTSSVHKPGLDITYQVGTDQPKTETVYLPPMRTPNCRYNVKCLIKDNGGLFVKCVPQEWDDVSHEYELSDIGQFTITEPNMRLFETGTDGKRYYATQYVEGADTQSRQLVFTLEMTSPEGVRWQAHLTNAQDFEFAGPAEGVGGGGAVTLQVRPTKVFDATGERPQTELYVTIGTADGTAQTFDANMAYTADGQTIHIVQVSAPEWDAITEQQP